MLISYNYCTNDHTLDALFIEWKYTNRENLKVLIKLNRGNIGRRILI